MWSTLGNHDGSSADSGTQTGPYYDIYNLPTSAEIGGLPSGTEAYYSFDYANIHFICLDSYDTDRAPAGTMMTWMQNDLAINTQPWVIAFWHHPPYSKGSHDSDDEDELIDMRENAVPLLEDMGVDLVLSGHSHSYERSYLLDGHYGNSLSLDPDLNVLNPGDGNQDGDGVYAKPYVIAAPGAGAVYVVAGSSGKVSEAPLDHPAMFVSLASLGSMLVDVSGNRMNVVFLDETGSVLDEFSIQKGPDLDPPLIIMASAEDANHVLVSFNESLDITEATKTGNYFISELNINAAELLVDNRSVRLTTSPMTSGSSYTLFVNNVRDLALNTILSDSQVGFDFFTTGGNNAPVAGFASSCTGLNCIFTDSSTDSDGTISSWSWDFGDGNGSSTQNPNHSYTVAGTYPVSLTVTDNGGLIDQTSKSVTASEPTGFTDYPVVADLPSAGSVSGTFADTLNDDTDIQVITERESGGKKNGRYSFLSHSWRFATASGSMVTFMTNAWSSGSTDGDTFEFAWSTDNINFTRLFYVSNSNTDNFQSAVIVASGTFYIRVTDTDQTTGHRERNSISIDQMFIRGDNTVPTEPPDEPLNLQVDSSTGSSVSLSWQHDGTDELNLDLQRRSPPITGDWGYLDSVAGGNTSYVDTTVAELQPYEYRVNAQNAAGTSPWSEPATATTPAAASITLISANGYKVKGRQKVDLVWSGASTSVDIIRDDATITTLSSEKTSFTDEIDLKGGADYVYKICNATGPPNCSDDALVVF
jgi:PKD repeat protein